MDLQSLLEKSAANHSHLCPRQILGVRMGLTGMRALGFDAPPPKKRLLVIVESDGCFADGIPLQPIAQWGTAPCAWKIMAKPPQCLWIHSPAGPCA
jgi:formylmethanofuran dehydrogenase subunit E